MATNARIGRAYSCIREKFVDGFLYRLQPALQWQIRRSLIIQGDVTADE